MTLESLFRPVICQVSLTVPLYQLRSSGGGVGQEPSEVGIAPGLLGEELDVQRVPEAVLDDGPRMVGLMM